MIEKLVRKNILNLKPYTSARDQYSEGILLDANENSLGTTASGFEDLHLNRYPDPHQLDMKKIAGRYYGIDQKNLFFGVGSDEIIDLLIRVFCDPGKDQVMILDPTYGMYKVACDINDVETISVNLTGEFQIDFDAVAKDFNEKVKIIFICSPNNPTGNLVNKNDILQLCKEYNSIIVVDEAYMDFAGNKSIASDVKDYPNLVVIRTFSKAWGLAGIRLGFSAADPFITDLLFKVKAPYNVSILTRYALFKAISNSAQKDMFVKKLSDERERIITELKIMPGIIKVFHSDANYILFKCENAKAVQKKLADDGIIIRDRSSYSMLENCLRVSVGTPDENDQFLKGIKKHLCTK